MFERFRKKLKEEHGIAPPVQPPSQVDKQARDNRTAYEIPIEQSFKVVILVDSSNVAHGNSAGKFEPKLDNLLSTLAQLNRTNAKVVAIADATLRHRVDSKELFEKMLENKEVLQVPAASSADDYIWDIALHHLKKGSQVFIVTNDRFPISKATTAESKKIKRISFMFVDNEVFFQPTLEEALKGVELAAEPNLKSKDSKTLSPKTEPANHSDASEKTPPKKQKKPVKVETKRKEVPPELLTLLVEFLSSRRPPVRLGDRINFAPLSNFLHKKYEGNFCSVFGFKRPKDFAVLLEQEGYVKISHHETTLYIEPMSKLLPETERREPSAGTTA